MQFLALNNIANFSSVEFSTFRLKSGVSKNELFKAADDAVKSLMAKEKGFVSLAFYQRVKWPLKAAWHPPSYMYIHNLIFALLLSILSLSSPVAFSNKVPNCDLKTIPSDAKRIFAHGVNFLVFPPVLGSSYTGCQIIWLEDGYKLSTRYFRDGKVVWLKGQEPKSKRSFYCAFEHGALVKEKSDIEKCPENISPR